jgi:hypothetical protein
MRFLARKVAHVKETLCPLCSLWLEILWGLETLGTADFGDSANSSPILSMPGRHPVSVLKSKAERGLIFCEIFVAFVLFAIKNVLFTKSVIASSVATWQSGDVHYSGLLPASYLAVAVTLETL